MKVLFLYFGVFSFHFFGIAQTCKVGTNQNSLYRISHRHLSEFGLNPETLQLWHRGVPYPFRNDSTFIEFWGKVNDGQLDSTLYRPSSAQPHQYYSLFSDSTWFYLGNVPAPKLVAQIPELQEKVFVFSKEYSFNSRSGPNPNLEQSYFEEGEGYTSPMIRGDSLAIIKIATPKDSFHVELLLHGRDEGKRQVRISVNGMPQKNIVWEGFKISTISFPYFSHSDSLRISTQSVGGGRYSWGYLKISGRGINEKPSNPKILNGTLQSLKTLNPTRLKGDFVIISHDKLMSAARQYAAYRAKRFDTLLVSVQQLYDTFTFGEKSPLAIIRFIEHLKKNQPPKHILLLGQATSIFDARDTEKDLVPTFGFPASDNLLLGSNPSRISIGRVSARNPEQVLAYLEKLKTYESQPIEAWRKHILHLNGGKSAEELKQFRNILAEQIPYIRKGILGEIETIQKSSVADVEKIDLSSRINAGIGMLSFFGHSSPIQPDLDFGYVSDPNRHYDNHRKYPFMFFNGCGIGNVFYGGSPLSTDWLLTANKGAIGVLAHSYTGFIQPLSEFTGAFYKELFSQQGMSIGEIHQRSITALRQNTNNPYQNANLDQMLLQGDPALVIFPKYDYASLSDSLSILSTSEAKPLLSASVVPNPAYQEVNFSIETPENKNSLRIYNTEGVLIKTFELDTTGNFTHVWEANSLPEGMYYYVITNSKASFWGKYLFFR